MKKILLTAALAIVMTACATKPAPLVQRAPITRIAIIPATDPTWYGLDNVSALQFLVPISQLGFLLDSKAKARIFNERIAAQPLQMGRSLTNVVAEALRAQGYEVELLSIDRIPDDPDEVDHDKLVTKADAVLHLRFSQVGLHSPRSAFAYLPRVNVRGMLFVPGRDPDYVYDGEIFFGVDARAGESWAIVADKQSSFPDFESVLARMAEVRALFLSGAQGIGRRMSGQVHDAIKR